MRTCEIEISFVLLESRWDPPKSTQVGFLDGMAIHRAGPFGAEH